MRLEKGVCKPSMESERALNSLQKKLSIAYASQEKLENDVSALEVEREELIEHAESAEEKVRALKLDPAKFGLKGEQWSYEVFALACQLYAAG